MIARTMFKCWNVRLYFRPYTLVLTKILIFQMSISVFISKHNSFLFLVPWNRIYAPMLYIYVKRREYSDCQMSVLHLAMVAIHQQRYKFFFLLLTIQVTTLGGSWHSSLSSADGADCLGEGSQHTSATVV